MRAEVALGRRHRGAEPSYLGAGPGPRLPVAGGGLWTPDAPAEGAWKGLRLVRKLKTAEMQLLAQPVPSKPRSWTWLCPVRFPRAGGFFSFLCVFFSIELGEA